MLVTLNSFFAHYQIVIQKKYRNKGNFVMRPKNSTDSKNYLKIRFFVESIDLSETLKKHISKFLR